MSHLDRDRIAALVGEEPTVAEAAHLAACALCARELGGQRTVKQLSTEWSREAVAPLTTWESLAAGLREEGLIRVEGVVPLRPARPRWVGAPWIQAAAAALLLAVGIGAGRWSAAMQLPSAPAQQLASAADSDSVTSGRSTARGDSAISIRNATEAIAILERAQREYQTAASFLAAQDTATGTSEDLGRYRTRLAALDQITTAALAAATEAPHDPVINQYYHSTIAARQVTLRQLGSRLPEGVRLTGY